MVYRDGLQIFPAVSGTANIDGNSHTDKNTRTAFSSGACLSWYGDYAQVYANSACTVSISGSLYSTSPDESSIVVIKIYVDDSLYTTIKDFGGWDAVQKKHFADGGVFDEIYEE